MTGGKFRIRMEAYDHQALDASAREIVDQAKRTGARVAGPIPLPTRREIYTVNRSPFIDKKSREQFEIRTHKRVIDITEWNHRTTDALQRLVVPAGVFLRIKAYTGLKNAYKTLKRLRAQLLVVATKPKDRGQQLPATV